VRCCVAVFILLVTTLTGAHAAPAPMRYIHNAPESAGDIRYEYQWEILRTALERTRASDGPYELLPAAAMTEQRQTDEMLAGSPTINVMYLGTEPDFETRLWPVRIPVDRNLGGYSILMARRETEAALAQVRSVQDLRRFSVGLGLGWLDVGILRSNGFNVVPGSSYDGLFQMLDNRRFDVFPRAVVEVLGEYERVHPAMPDLVLDDKLILYYPLPMYFWFQRTPEGKRLAARARKGLLAMIADGSYQRIFDKHQGWKIKRLKLERRRLLAIHNPLLGPETPFDDARLWYRLPGQRSLTP